MLGGPPDPTIELEGAWRLFTRADLTRTMGDWKPAAQRSANAERSQVPHVNATEPAVGNAVATLRRHVNALEFEHGTERKVPRADAYRPYRFTVDGTIVALVTLRASEAFNLCEVDVFFTTQLPGLAPLEATRAALLFAFSDAVKNGGSMAVQFTRNCSPEGVPRSVGALAEQLGVELRHASRGAISPTEARELYLRLCGLGENAERRVREFAGQGLFSVERVCALVTLGIWPAAEAAEILACSPYPDLVLGSGVETTSRHLSAHALGFAQSAILGGCFARALRCAPEAGPLETSVRVRSQVPAIPRQLDVDRHSTGYGPLPQSITLSGWTPGSGDDGALVFSGGTTIELLARGRTPEAIRVFLMQDLEEARAVKGSGSGAVVLAYPADYLELTAEDRAEAEAAARHRGVTLLVCPESSAALEMEAWRRVRVGKTVRK